MPSFVFGDRSKPIDPSKRHLHIFAVGWPPFPDPFDHEPERDRITYMGGPLTHDEARKAAYLFLGVDETNSRQQMQANVDSNEGVYGRMDYATGFNVVCLSEELLSTRRKQDYSRAWRQARAAITGSAL